MSNKSSRARSYCFTINNWNETDAAQLQALWDSGKVKYFVAGKETGEEGTPHIQGYVMFKAPTAFSTIKGFLGRAHIEIARGTPEQNIEYCTKDGDYMEEGNRPMTQSEKGQKGKEYWEAQVKLAQDNRLEECDPKLIAHHFKTLVAIRDYYLKDLGNNYRPGCHNYWFYGPTGAGKSRQVRETWCDVYYKMANKWWNNYGMQETVLIEDLDKSHHVLGHHLKLWADSYPFRGEVKNSTMMARPKTIVVTSNYHPSEIWEDKNMLDPILRRFTVVKFPLALGMKFKPFSDDEPDRMQPYGEPDEEMTPPATLPIAGEEGEFFFEREDEICHECAMPIDHSHGMAGVGHLRTCKYYPHRPTPKIEKKRQKLFK